MSLLDARGHAYAPSRRFLPQPLHGLAGGIVGRALYTGAVDLGEALAAVEAACS